MDEIIKDVRAVRESYAAKFGYDVRALYADAIKREGKRGHKVELLEPRIVARKEEVTTQSESRNKPVYKEDAKT